MARGNGERAVEGDGVAVPGLPDGGGALDAAEGNRGSHAPPRQLGDRDAAEGLRGSILEVERSADERPDDPEEFYDSQLVGCAAVIDDETVGEVTEVVHLPAHDLLSVRLSGAADGTPDVLVPFVRAIVPTVDLGARRVVLTPPPGLLDSPDAIEESEAT